MKQKALFTILLFFLPVLQRFISLQLLHIEIASLKYEAIASLSIVTLLFIVIMPTVIYFWISIIKWINSGFKLKKLIPCIISFASIFCLFYSIKAIINKYIKNIKNRIQRIPNVFIKKTFRSYKVHLYYNPLQKTDSTVQ